MGAWYEWLFNKMSMLEIYSFFNFSGVHTVSKDCDAKKKLAEVERFYFDNRNLFFPKEFKQTFTNHNQIENSLIPNGGILILFYETFEIIG